jgi:hypothetical protein
VGLLARPTLASPLFSGFFESKKNAAQMRGVFYWAPVAPNYDYFETERRNIRSIFSFVASQQLWLA